MEALTFRVEETKTGVPLELPITHQLAAILERRRAAAALLLLAGALSFGLTPGPVQAQNTLTLAGPQLDEGADGVASGVRSGVAIDAQQRVTLDSFDFFFNQTPFPEATRSHGISTVDSLTF